MALHSWIIYLVAVIGLSVTPGPNTLLALTHGALHGHRKALCTIAGGAVGFVALIALSMLGIKIGEADIRVTDARCQQSVLVQ